MATPIQRACTVQDVIGQRPSARRTRAALVALSVVLFPFSAECAEPLSLEYHAETYQSEGSAVGCGFSFFTTWQGEARRLFGATGSVNFFFPDPANFGSAIKISGAIDGKKALVSFGWLEVSGYGDTKNFTRQAASDDQSYTANKKPDGNGVGLVGLALTKGSKLGIHFSGLPLDEVIRLHPVAEVSTAEDFQVCLRQLIGRINSFKAP